MAELLVILAILEYPQTNGRNSEELTDPLASRIARGGFRMSLNAMAVEFQ
jgi:hypothetical protein